MSYLEFVEKLLDLQDATSLITYSFVDGEYLGVIRRDDTIIGMHIWKDHAAFMETSIVNHLLNVYEGANGLLKEIPDATFCVLDMGASGRRWEGGVLDNQPYGYGIEYDEDGQMVYEGTMLRGEKFGYGTEYHDGNIKFYEGSFISDRKHGFGCLYDRNGHMENEGQYVLDKPLRDTVDSFLVHNRMETISIPSNTNTDISSLILLDCLQGIRTITIGNSCFPKVRQLEIRGMKRLERLTIGTDSFTQKQESKERLDGTCCVINCTSLRFIDIGNRSFEDFHTLQLKSLPTLETLQLGENCFQYSPLLTLNGKTNTLSRPDLPHLRSILFHEWAFRYCHAAVLSSGDCGLLEP